MTSNDDVQKLDVQLIDDLRGIPPAEVLEQHRTEFEGSVKVPGFKFQLKRVSEWLKKIS